MMFSIVKDRDQNRFDLYKDALFFCSDPSVISLTDSPLMPRVASSCCATFFILLRVRSEKCI